MFVGLTDDLGWTWWRSEYILNEAFAIVGALLLMALIGINEPVLTDGLWHTVVNTVARDGG